MIVSSFFKALGQALTDGRFAGVLVMGIALTLALLAGLTGLVLWGVHWLTPDAIRLFGWEITVVDDILSWASVGVMLLLSTVLMVPVASAFTGLFLERVANAVEEAHYPHLPDIAPLPLGDVLADSAGFFALLVAVNLGALVFYVFAGPLAPLLFWAVNGFLLGREYYQLVAMRRLGRAEARRSRRRHFGRIWLAGILMAAPLTIPIVNLIVPILGVATFTHVFHTLERSPRGPDL